MGNSGPRRGDRRPTMRNVAAAAGVSLKTVSRVVNGEGGVRADLVGKVERAIDESGYQRDELARQLRARAGDSKLIGFVQTDVARPFFSAIFRAIEDVAAARGYEVIAGSSDGKPEQQEAVLRALIGRRVDGLIVVHSGDRIGALIDEVERGTPVVCVDLDAPASLHVDRVRSDHHGGARVLTEHLIRHGHRAIAFIGDLPTFSSAAERYRGFEQAMRDAGLRIRTEWVHRDAGDWSRSRDIVVTLVGSHPGSSAPTALVTAHDFVTIGAVRALHALGLEHDVALAGFDDVDLADVVDPGITVMPQSPLFLGRRAAQLLFDRLDGDTSPPVLVVPDDRIIVRGSGEIRPAPVAAARGR